MLEVFSNVFGRPKKPTTNQNGQSQDQDGFEVIGETTNDKTAVLDTDRTMADPPPTYQPRQNMVTDRRIHWSPMDDVPFIVNPSFRISNDAENIWRELAQCLESLRTIDVNQGNYYFELEHSVLQEMSTPNGKI